MTFSFGAAPAASSTGFTLGAPPAKAPAAGSSFSFGGTAKAATSAPGFGGFAATSTSAPTAAVAPTFGGGFGSTATAATTAPPSFGAATATPSLGGFGASTAQTPVAAPAFGGFGGAATATTTTATAAPAFGGFGASATPSTAPPSFGAATATPSFGGFGATTATTSAAPPAFGAATATPSLNFGATATAVSSAPALGGFGASPATTTTTVSGLGGNTTGGGLLGANTGQSTTAVENKTDNANNSKESPIPAELNAVVESLKNMIKEEKSISSEISHTTDKQIKQVKEDTEALQQMVSGLTSTLQNNRLKLDQLKHNCGQELANVDICVKTRDTPASMQYDNVAPMEYFSRLVTQFEHSMLEYRQAIQTAETHLQAVASGSSGLSPEDIVSAVQRMHQALTHLAAKYQAIHTTINEYKSQFRVQSKHTAIPPASLSGPSPFLAPADPLTIARQSLTAPHGPPVQSLGQQQSAFGAGQFGAPSQGMFNSSSTFGGAGNSSMFGTSTFGASNTSFGANNQNNSFSVGQKRNKH